jgi:hypothetical protein
MSAKHVTDVKAMLGGKQKKKREKGHFIYYMTLELKS